MSYRSDGCNWLSAVHVPIPTIGRVGKDWSGFHTIRRRSEIEN
ncbi:hypothetical protein AB0758_33935 [Tolypothrix bouteillei VB521301_2]